MRTKIIYEDTSILVIHKPSGLATQTDRLGQMDVVNELKNYLAGQGVKNPYIGVIHRLDQPVEGLLVFAKNRQMAASLSEQLAEGTLKKQYYALVCGKPAMHEGQLVDYLLKNSSGVAEIIDENKLKEKRYAQAKQARLRYKLVSVREDADASCSLLEIELFTGRFHQIRAQMAHAGYPLLGDKKYGNPQSEKLSLQFHIRQTALLAYYLSFVHPATGEEQTYELPIPENWYLSQ